MLKNKAPAAKSGKIVDLNFKMLPLWVPLSMLLIPRFVNGAEPNILKSSAPATLESAIQRLLAQGEAGKFVGITRFPRIENNSPIKEEWAFPKASEDRNRRSFSAILDRSTETQKATHVEFFVTQKDRPAQKEQQFFILVSTTGALLEAGFSLGSLDEKGKWIPGPSLIPFKYLDITSPETRALFQREMDFWVRGVGRKAPVAPTKEEGTKPPEKPAAEQGKAP